MVLSALAEGDRELDAEEGGEGDPITVLPVVRDEAATMDVGEMGTTYTSMLLASSASSGLGVVSHL